MEPGSGPAVKKKKKKKKRSKRKDSTALKKKPKLKRKRKRSSSGGASSGDLTREPSDKFPLSLNPSSPSMSQSPCLSKNHDARSHSSPPPVWMPLPAPSHDAELPVISADHGQSLSQLEVSAGPLPEIQEDGKTAASLEDDQMANPTPQPPPTPTDEKTRSQSPGGGDDVGGGRRREPVPEDSNSIGGGERKSHSPSTSSVIRSEATHDKREGGETLVRQQGHVLTRGTANVPSSSKGGERDHGVVSDKVHAMLRWYKERIKDQPIQEPVMERLERYFPRDTETHNRRLFFQPAVCAVENLQTSNGMSSQMTKYQLKTAETKLDHALAQERNIRQEFEDHGVDSTFARHVQLTATYLAARLHAMGYCVRDPGERDKWKSRNKTEGWTQVNTRFGLFDTSALRATCVLVEEFIAETLAEEMLKILPSSSCERDKHN